MDVKDIMITSVDTINGFDITTGSYLFTLDELQQVTLSNSEEKTEITGKQGRKLANLKRNKAVSITGDNGLISGGLLEMQTGGKFKTEATEVLWTDYLTVTSNAASTSYKAIGTTGAEIEALYIVKTDGTAGEELTQADTAASGKFAYNPTSKALTFSGIEDGTEIVVFYKRKITASVLINGSETYSTKCTLYIDATGEDTCSNVYRVQIYVPKADFDGNFDFAMGDSQTVHSFTAESLAGACGTGGNLWYYTVFGVNTEDE